MRCHLAPAIMASLFLQTDSLLNILSRATMPIPLLDRFPRSSQKDRTCQDKRVNLGMRPIPEYAGRIKANKSRKSCRGFCRCSITSEQITKSYNSPGRHELFRSCSCQLIFSRSPAGRAAISVPVKTQSGNFSERIVSNSSLPAPKSRIF